MRLNDSGEVAEQYWRNIPHHFPPLHFSSTSQHHPYIPPNHISTSKSTDKPRGTSRTIGSIVRFNALKHGLLAKEVVVLAGEGAEDPMEFQQVLEDLKQERQPVGTIEEMLVEKIATLYWRLRRAHRYEVGLIRQRLDTATDDYLNETDWRGEKVNDKAGKLREEIAEQQRSYDYWKKDKVELSALFKKKKPLSDIYEWEENWNYSFDDNEDELAEHFESAYPDAGELHSHLVNELDWTDEKIWKALIKNCEDIMTFHADKLKELQEQLAVEEEKNRMRLEVKGKLGQMPGKDSLDRLLRYEGALSRQFYKALNELERIQRLRQGDVVPPPMDINVEVNQSAEG